MATTIEIDDAITVGDLAEKLMIPATRLIAELMKNGVMVTLNERIDFDTAQIIAGEIEDLDVELVKAQEESKIKRTKPVASKDAKSRPPVVAVMGHVDHGKTSLLDAIIGHNVTDQEAGGITQHISAYQINHNGRDVTFLDTPGHEAFAAIREHGAALTDLAVIVVAADDGVKPQTLEAIRFAKEAGVKMIVALNKIDKPDADANRVKQQLSEHDVLIEEWGGDTVALGVSAKTKEGLDDLIDMIFLVADVEELKADTAGPASGLIIESHLEKGLGPTGIALVEAGILTKGDFVVAGSTYAKVKDIKTTTGKELDRATPSTPILITGFKELPEFGDEFCVAKDEKTARKLAETARQGKKLGKDKNNINSSQLIRMMDRNRAVTELPVIIKADVRGSLTSVQSSLKSLETDEVSVRIVGSGIGPVNDNDMHLAKTAGAVVYSFNVVVPSSMNRVAMRDKLTIMNFNVIYELIDDVRSRLSDLLAPEIVEKPLGKLIVKGIFKTEKSEVICGGEVTVGKLTAPALVRVMRDKKEIAEAELVNLKKGPQDTKEVVEGEMCGMTLKTTGKLILEEGDKLEVFTRETVERSL